MAVTGMAEMERASPMQRVAGLERVLEAVTTGGVLGGLLMPAVAIPGVFHHHAFSRMVFFQVLVDLTFPAWVWLAWRHPRMRPAWRGPLGGLTLLMVVMGVAALAAEDPVRAWWGQAGRMGGLFSWLHLLAWTAMAAGSGRWRVLLQAAAALGVGMALVACVQVVSPQFLMMGLPPGDRVAGLQGNPIFMATCTVFSFFLAWCSLRLAHGPWQRRMWGLGMVACMAAILASASRGPLLGLLVGLGAAGMWGAATAAGRQGGTRLLAGVVVSGALAWAGLVLWWAPASSANGFLSRHPNVARLFVPGDPARMATWRITWDAVQQHPWLGWGLENGDAAYVAAYRPLNACTPLYEDRPHNQPLEVLLGGGFLGLCAWALLWWLLARSAWRLGKVPGAISGLAMPFVGLLAAHVVQGMVAFDSPPSMFLFCLTCALLQVLAAPLDPQRPRAGASQPHPAAWLVGMCAGAWVAVTWSLMPFAGAMRAVKANTAMQRGDLGTMVQEDLRALPWMHPYEEEWLLAVSIQLGQVAASGRLDGVPDWKDLWAAALRQASSTLSERGARARVLPAYATMLHQVGRAAHDPTALHAAATLLDQELLANPLRPNILMDRADIMLAMGDDGSVSGRLYARAVEVAPDQALVDWRAGLHAWKHGQDRAAAARLLVKATKCPCGFAWSPVQVAQLAHAHAVLGQEEQLKALALRVDAFPQGASMAMLSMAGLYEDHGWREQRDVVLTALVKADRTMGRFRRVLGGSSTMRALEQSQTP